MKQKIKAITDLALPANITEARQITGLVGYHRGFFPFFSNTIRPLNELTKKNVPFKWTDQCQKSLEYIKQVITTNLILIYPDPNKQYFLFTDSSKHSWSGILIQHSDQTKDNWTKIKIPHPITYQSRTFQGSTKNWSILIKEAYAIYMSFWKIVFHLKEAHVMGLKWSCPPSGNTCTP